MWFLYWKSGRKNRIFVKTEQPMEWLDFFVSFVMIGYLFQFDGGDWTANQRQNPSMWTSFSAARSNEAQSVSTSILFKLSVLCLRLRWELMTDSTVELAEIPRSINYLFPVISCSLPNWNQLSNQNEVNAPFPISTLCNSLAISLSIFISEQ